MTISTPAGSQQALTSLLSTLLSVNHLASRAKGSAPPGAAADATPLAAMLAAVTVGAAPLPLAVPLASGAEPFASGAAAAAAAAGAAGRLPMEGHCTPAMVTVTGVRSGSRVRRNVEPFSTASTRPEGTPASVTGSRNSEGQEKVN